MNYTKIYTEQARRYVKAINGKKGEVAWQSPSNIALVKYWGKRHNQIPENPSISFTLSESYTQTRVLYEVGMSGRLIFRFNGQANPVFGKRINSYLDNISVFFPFITNISLEIHSTNSFPHSSGIASSASAFSALALCICQIEQQLFGLNESPEAFFTKASFMARLGSGSAARSLFPEMALWGKSAFYPQSSNEVAIVLTDYHKVFSRFHDSILLIDEGQKTVSSTVGHGLMHANPYAKQRFQQANNHIALLQEVLKSGDVMRFAELVEQEALTLHAMMLASSPGYLLFKPGTIAVIDKIRNFRNSNHVPICFTLDAGANVHCLYPEENEHAVKKFIESELLAYCSQNKVIHDKVGEGAVQI